MAELILKKWPKKTYKEKTPKGIIQLCLLTLKMQSSWWPKTISSMLSTSCVKKINSGTNPYPFCESDFYMNYMSMCAKSGLRNKLCRHLR